MAEEGDVKSDLETKKSLIAGKLQKREEGRLQNIQQRKATKQEGIVVEETADFFKKEFDQLQEEIELGLAESVKISVNDRQSHFDNLSVSVQKLQKLLTRATPFLSSFGVQKAQEVVNQLKSSIEDKRLTVLPKKKFAFKSDKKKMTTSSNDASDRLDGAAVKPKTIADVQSEVCGFSNTSDKILSLAREETNRNDVTLSSLSNCVVRLYGSPTALHISNLTDCRVFCGPVSGSAFIDGCLRCTFVLPCHQLRVHTTSETEFYLHVTSRAIIEDCRLVNFAPYNWYYDRIEQDYDLSGLNRSRNNWNDVDDFNWLVADVPSPNWSLINEEKRVISWD